ncbi:hypothetical protein M0638_24490 [Roseomonas sp. NAR14]|uniref:Uncharacterized protein n=1 Tax=Roseomonas acroporae TaxID=2937791 RepID=A0A9X1YCC7_9PROT|nr:hypothetical protein [Roseomonas acroporae]MCK8787533.1 hypothetical protein [Roseomonas acroporae]
MSTPRPDLLDWLMFYRGTAGRVVGLVAGLGAYLLIDGETWLRIVIALVVMRLLGPWGFELVLRPFAEARERRRALERSAAGE